MSLRIRVSVEFLHLVSKARDLAKGGDSSWAV